MALKFRPVSVTTVPAPPHDGEIAATCGYARYVNVALPSPKAGAGLRTLTAATCSLMVDGVTAVTVVLFTYTLPVASPSISTVTPGTNPVPVMVIGVPPKSGPEAGVTAVTVVTGLAMVSVAVADPEPL